jgi:hypothetical protein
MLTPKASVGRVKAREACVIVVGAKPVEWHRRIVRDNRTGKLAEIDVHEIGPKVPEVPGTTTSSNPTKRSRPTTPRCSIAQARLSQSRAERSNLGRHAKRPWGEDPCWATRGRGRP